MNIGIIGAGATGLTSGYFLSKQGHDVTILEAQDSVGGLVSTMKIGNSELERFYHHIFTSDNEIIKLIQELGLSDKLKWYTSKSGIFINDKMYPFSTPMDLLRFKELSIFDRISMGLLVYKAKYVKEWEKLEGINAKEWIVNNSNKRVYDSVWGPLINSKFDIDADQISAVWIWNKFKLRGSTRDKNLSKELLGYMDGSFGQIYKELEQSIINNHGEVVYNTKVDSIKLTSNKAFEVYAKDKVYKFDKLIVTTAPNLLIEMGLPFEQQYIDKLEKIRYKANICMVLELKESISPYYWTTVADNTIPFVLMIEHTNLIKTDEYKSKIVYLSRYLDESHSLYSLTDDKIKELFVDGIKKINPRFNKEKIINFHINRSRFTQPVIGKQYSNIKLDYKTPIENLFLASMSQVYPEDRGQNYAIRMGIQIAELVGKM